MNPDTQGEAIARRTLNLLLGAPLNADDWNRTDWDFFISMARKNLVLVRSFEALEKRGVPVPQTFREVVLDEKRRVGLVMDIVKKTGRLCEANDIPYLLPTVLQHYPDMGGDIDLLLPDSSREMDGLLEREFGVQRLSPGLPGRIGGESAFVLETPFPSIEVHYGRIGLAGEHRLFPIHLFRHKKVASVDGVEIPVPSPEDRLLLQTIQRLYGRFYFRISDLVHPIALLRDTPLNWDYVLKTASDIGIADGLGVYLSLLGTIYHDLFGRPLFPEWVGKRVRSGNSGRLSFRRSYYRYPMVAVTGRIYGAKIVDDLFSGRWAGALRLGLLPAVALAYLARNVLGRRSRYFS